MQAESPGSIPGSSTRKVIMTKTFAERLIEDLGEKVEVPQMVQVNLNDVALESFGKTKEMARVLNEVGIQRDAVSLFALVMLVVASSKEMHVSKENLHEVVDAAWEALVNSANEN